MTVSRKDDRQNGGQMMSSKMMKNDSNIQVQLEQQQQAHLEPSGNSSSHLNNQSGYDIDLGRQTIKPPSLSPPKQTTDTPRTRTRKTSWNQNPNGIETTIKPIIHVISNLHIASFYYKRHFG